MTAHAEVAQVWPRDGRIRILGEIVSAETYAGESWRLRLSSRERRKAKPSLVKRAVGKVRRLTGGDVPPPGVVVVPVTMDGRDFEADIPLSAFVHSHPLHWEHWDLYLVGSSTTRPVSLRLGKLDDDLPGKKTIVTFPQQTVTTPFRLSVRPYFTDAEHLAIRCYHNTKPRTE